MECNNKNLYDSYQTLRRDFEIQSTIIKSLGLLYMYR
jgi:hypothetical protein